MLNEQPSDLLEKLRQEYNLSELQFRFMSEFLNLSPDERDTIFSFLTHIFGRNAVTLVKENNDDNSIQNKLCSDDLKSTGQTDTELEKKLNNYLHELEDEKREKTLPVSHQPGENAV
jgi:hypothetical protein